MELQSLSSADGLAVQSYFYFFIKKILQQLQFSSYDKGLCLFRSAYSLTSMLSVQCFSWKKVQKKAALMCKDNHPEKSSLLRVSWLDMRIFDIQKAVLLLKTFFFLRVVSVCMKP